MSSVMDNIEIPISSSDDKPKGKKRGFKAHERMPMRADGLPKIPYLRLFLNIVIGVFLFTAYRYYIEYHAFTYGLDYFEPEFQVFYMRLLYIQLPLITVVGALTVLWILWSRPKEVNMTPQQELSVYYLFFGIFAISGIFAIVIFGIFVEADAAWHQVAIRDTDFTPTHISLFYMAIPVACVALASVAAWVHTRMPDFRNRISVPLMLMAGSPILIMPNLGFNEWGHTFFYAEELFAAPVHWGFVVLGWGLFGVGGFFMQCVARVKVLTDLPEQAAIQNNETATAKAAS